MGITSHIVWNPNFSSFTEITVYVYGVRNNLGIIVYYPGTKFETP